MKDFIAQYLKILSYTTIGLMLIVSGFYLIMNYYHSEELKTSLYITDSDINYQSYNQKLEDIQTNLNKFSNSKSTNKAYKNMYVKLLSCNNMLKSSGTLAKIEPNTYFTPYDIYQLGANLQTSLLNGCWASNLSYITDENAPSEFREFASYLNTSIELITNQTNNALNEIQGNSSYFYTTNVTSATIRNYLNADYQMIASSYNKFANIILNLSSKINTSVENGGNLDD